MGNSPPTRKRAGMPLMVTRLGSASTWTSWSSLSASITVVRLRPKVIEAWVGVAPTAPAMALLVAMPVPVATPSPFSTPNTRPGRATRRRSSS